MEWGGWGIQVKLLAMKQWEGGWRTTMRITWKVKPTQNDMGILPADCFETWNVTLPWVSSHPLACPVDSGLAVSTILSKYLKLSPLPLSLSPQSVDLMMFIIIINDIVTGTLLNLYPMILALLLPHFTEEETEAKRLNRLYKDT